MPKELDITASEQLRLAARGYKLIRKLGEGTYAAVYLVDFKNPKTKKEQQLACKMMDVTKMAPEFVQKFLPRELDIISKINHPHIIQIQNIFQRNTKYFIFMRFAEHGDLLEFILKKGSLSECQARVWFRQISLAVHYLHEMDVAHRDLKCENIFITTNYNIKVADFGFARHTVDDNGRRVTSSTFCGSLSYAPPEILRGVPYLPKAADMWSLGVILFIMVNKSMPFDDGNVKKLYEQQTAKRWRFRPKVTNILSEECKSLAGHLLEPDVFKRWKAEQVVFSDWIAMDKRLTELTTSEENALKQAQRDKKKREYANFGSSSKLSQRSVSQHNQASKLWNNKEDSVEDIRVTVEESERCSAVAVSPIPTDEEIVTAKTQKLGYLFDDKNNS